MKAVVFLRMVRKWGKQKWVTSCIFGSTRISNGLNENKLKNIIIHYLIFYIPCMNLKLMIIFLYRMLDEEKNKTIVRGWKFWNKNRLKYDETPCTPNSKAFTQIKWSIGAWNSCCNRTLSFYDTQELWKFLFLLIFFCCRIYHYFPTILVNSISWFNGWLIVCLYFTSTSRDYFVLKKVIFDGCISHIKFSIRDKKIDHRNSCSFTQHQKLLQYLNNSSHILK